MIEFISSTKKTVYKKRNEVTTDHFMMSECYETPDLPSVSPILRDVRVPDTPKESQVFETSISSSESFKQFAGASLNTSHQNFDRVAIGTSSKLHEYSVNPGAKNSESPLERFRRLRAEVNALAKDLQIVENDSEGLQLEQGVTVTEIASHVEELDQILNNCEASLSRTTFNPSSLTSSNAIATRLLHELSATPASGEEKDRVTYELYCNNQLSNDNQALLEMERRVTQLEKGIGATSSLQKPLAPTLSVLEEKISLLDATKLGIIESKVSKLGESLKNVTETPQANERLDILFNMMNQWDESSQQVPDVIDRLVCLKDIHEQSASAVQTAQQLESDQDAISLLLQNSLSTFEQLEKSFEENKGIISKNVASLDARMKQLELKFQ